MSTHWTTVRILKSKPKVNNVFLKPTKTFLVHTLNQTAFHNVAHVLLAERQPKQWNDWHCCLYIFFCYLFRERLCRIWKLLPFAAWVPIWQYLVEKQFTPASSPRKIRLGDTGQWAENQHHKGFFLTLILTDWYFCVIYKPNQTKHFTKLLCEHQSQVLWCFVNVQVQIGVSWTASYKRTKQKTN